MRKGRMKYLFLIALGVILTPTAIQEAFETRQAFYIGGEWLIIPLFLLSCLVVDSFKGFYRDFKRSMKYDQRIDG